MCSAFCVRDTKCCSSFRKLFVTCSQQLAADLQPFLFLFVLGLFLDGPRVIRNDERTAHVILVIRGSSSKKSRTLIVKMPKMLSPVWEGLDWFLIHFRPTLSRNPVNSELGDIRPTCKRATDSQMWIALCCGNSRCIMWALKHAGITLHRG